MSDATAERRERHDPDGMATKMEASFDALDPDDKDRLQIIGAALILLCIAAPIIGGLFIELGGIYLTFCAAGAGIGLLLAWPRAGLMVLQGLFKLASKFVRTKKLSELVAPVDRRGERTEEE